MVRKFLYIFFVLSYLFPLTTFSKGSKGKKSPSINLEWQKSDSARYYHIQVSLKEDFKPLLFEKKTKKTNLKLSVKKSNDFFWRVRIFDKKEKKYSPFSNVGMIHFSLRAPVSTAESNLTIEDNKRPYFYLSWKKTSKKKNNKYVLQLSEKADFSDSRTFFLKKKYFKFPGSMKNNLIYWRVAHHSKKAEKKPDYSGIYTQELVISEDNQKSKLIMLYPMKKESISSTGASKLVDFKWFTSKDNILVCAYFCHEKKCTKDNVKIIETKENVTSLTLKSGQEHSWYVHSLRKKKVKKVKKGSKGKTRCVFKKSKLKRYTRFTIEKSSSSMKLDLFFSTSTGTYNEILLLPSAKKVLAKNVQNSPLTIGFASNYKFKKYTKMSFSSSFYFSFINKAVDRLNNNEISILPETGLTAYLNYNIKLKSNQFHIYGGFDYENLSSYNLEEVYNGELLNTKVHGFVYFSTGIFKLFKIKNQYIFLKGSFSYTLASSTYTGYKYIAYINYKLYSKISLHVFYKKHILDGPTQLSIERVGFGFNYNLIGL